MQQNLLLSDFDFDLPEDRIAQYPLADRTASRLLTILAQQDFQDRHFTDIVDLLHEGDVLVVNNTRVIKARLHGHKPTGGQLEALIERVMGEFEALAMIRASKAPKEGSTITFEQGQSHVNATVLGRSGMFFHLKFDEPVLDVLDRCGEIPLPPYITHKADEKDSTRYQTVYAQHPGAVAAPTAGLHFTEALLEKIRQKGIQTLEVTLHVGAGTFQPVRVERLDEHVMHSEWFEVKPEVAQAINQAKREGRRVIAVGTTSCRTLESAAVAPGVIEPGCRDTQLFITPGYSFKIIDALITNFHLPKSTLVMLVSALAGRERMLKAYAHAVQQHYRFFSYGDACYIEKDERIPELM